MRPSRFARLGQPPIKSYYVDGANFLIQWMAADLWRAAKHEALLANGYVLVGPDEYMKEDIMANSASGAESSKKTSTTTAAIKRFEGEFHFLSNFYANAPFEWKGDVWKTGEHAFQAAKAADRIDYDRIRDCATPGAAKRLGRQVRMVPGWENKRLAVMLDLLKAKFSVEEQPAMAARLLLTSDAELVEGNDWGDVFWGVDAKTGVGQNQLGLALMIVRHLIRSKANDLEGLV